MQYHWPILTLTLALTLTLIGCGPKVAPRAPIEPVYFDSNSNELAYVFDYIYVGQIVDRMQADPTCHLALIGYADSIGSEASNQRLSEDRAAYVKGLIVENNISPERLFVEGMGEQDATDIPSEDDRRVVFYLQCGIEEDDEPTAASIITASRAAAAEQAELLAKAEAKKSGKKSSKSSKSKDLSTPPEREVIVYTGLTEMDDFFAKVQDLLDTFRVTSDSIYASIGKLQTAVGVAEGEDLGSALARLKAAAPGAISVTMNGSTPEISLAAGAPTEVKNAVTAMKETIKTLDAAVKNLSAVPGKAMGLINEAKALPGKVPNMAKTAGLSMGEVPKVLKAVKHNVSVTTGIPGEIADTAGAMTELTKVITGTFSGS